MAERLAVTEEGKEDQRIGLAKLVSDLQHAGFDAEPNSMASPENLCRWYAWRQLAGARDCECNDRPPSLIVTPHLYAMRDRQYASIDVSITGQHGEWFKLQAYSVAPEGLIAALPGIEAALVRAWNALPAPPAAASGQAAVVQPDTMQSTQAELDAITREMDVIYGRWPKTKKEDDEHRAIREQLLAPLRARCVEIGNRRYALAAASSAQTDDALEVLAFLKGEGPLDGVWFGNPHPTERGAFWWRKHLRAAFPLPPAGTAGGGGR